MTQSEVDFMKKCIWIFIIIILVEFNYNFEEVETKSGHFKEKTISQPSYLYNGNPHTWKDQG